MSGIAFHIQVVVGKIIGYSIAVFVLFRIFWSFVRHPIRFTKATFFKQRVMPTCLNDPNLGNHEFAHLEVSHEMLLLSDSLSSDHKSHRFRPTTMKQIARLSFSPVDEREK